MLGEEPFPFFTAVLISQEEPRRSTGRSLERTRAQWNSEPFLIILIEVKKKSQTFLFVCRICVPSTVSVFVYYVDVYVVWWGVVGCVCLLDLV